MSLTTDLKIIIVYYYWNIYVPSTIISQKNHFQFISHCALMVSIFLIPCWPLCFMYSCSVFTRSFLMKKYEQALYLLFILKSWELCKCFRSVNTALLSFVSRTWQLLRSWNQDSGPIKIEKRHSSTQCVACIQYNAKTAGWNRPVIMEGN